MRGASRPTDPAPRTTHEVAGTDHGDDTRRGVFEAGGDLDRDAGMPPNRPCDGAASMPPGGTRSPRTPPGAAARPPVPAPPRSAPAGAPCGNTGAVGKRRSDGPERRVGPSPEQPGSPSGVRVVIDDLPAPRRRAGAYRRSTPAKRRSAPAAVSGATPSHDATPMAASALSRLWRPGTVSSSPISSHRPRIFIVTRPSTRPTRSPCDPHARSPTVPRRRTSPRDADNAPQSAPPGIVGARDQATVLRLARPQTSRPRGRARRALVRLQVLVVHVRHDGQSRGPDAETTGRSRRLRRP